MKLVRYSEVAAADFAHPIKANFFAAISISLLLISATLLPYSIDMATVVWGTGAVVHLGFTLSLIARWIKQSHEVIHANPAWFIPVVGNILVPLVGVKLGYLEISWFFFSIGSVFWIVLFTIIFNRVVFHHDPLPRKFMPTLFILIAPPAVGYLAYINLAGGEIDAFARILFYVALFITALMFSMVRVFAQLPFALSWWAYTFPLDAMTIAICDYADRTGSTFFNGLAMVMLIVTSLVIGFVAFRTIKAVMAGKVFAPE